eukprot:365390-Chlamydomonas_euryale.AAC.21
MARPLPFPKKQKAMVTPRAPPPNSSCPPMARASPVRKHGAAARAGAATWRVRLLHVPDHRAAGVEHVHDEVLLKARGAAAVVVATEAAGVGTQAVLVHQRAACLVERQHVVGRGAVAARLEAPTRGAALALSKLKEGVTRDPSCTVWACGCLQRTNGRGLPAAPRPSLSPGFGPPPTHGASDLERCFYYGQ